MKAPSTHTHCGSSDEQAQKVPSRRQMNQLTVTHEADGTLFNAEQKWVTQP